MPLTRITIRQCEAFAAVADTLSFVAAAERLGLTSSAVSQLVAELEGIVDFRLFDRSTRRVAELLVERVSNGDLDLAIGPDRPPDPAVVRQSIYSSPWVLWCATTHPLAAKKAVRWEDLRKVALVAAGRDHEVSVDQMRLGHPDGQAIVPIEVVDNITTALGIAAEGIAATLSPAYVGVAARNFGLTMRRVIEPETIRHVSLYRPSLRSIPPAAEAFEEFLVNWMQRWSAKTTTVVARRAKHGVRSTRS